jgi:hypothetical protein
MKEKEYQSTISRGEWHVEYAGFGRLTIKNDKENTETFTLNLEGN